MSGGKKIELALQLSAMTAEELVSLLDRQGMGAIGVEKINELVKNGAPRNQDGTFNLLDVAAWLTRNAKNGC